MSNSALNQEIDPTILRRFTIQKKLGSGAYGYVWRVIDRSDTKCYALKKIFDAFQHEVDAQRTYRQIDILRKIKHTDIIRLREVIRTDSPKDVYLLFDYMPSDLYQAIQVNCLLEIHWRYIVYQLARGLHYLHSGKLIHRDLKPSNILIDSDSKIKLCDFGLVRSLSGLTEDTQSLTQGVATRWYRAPEVLLGSKSYSSPVDIWSLGCIIYEMIQRKPMFKGDSVSEQLEKILAFTGMPSDIDLEAISSPASKSIISSLKPSSLVDLVKGIPPSFAKLIRDCLTFNPDKRITAKDILQNQMFTAFRKHENELVCMTPISTDVDDNQKYRVNDYRKLIQYMSVADSCKDPRNIQPKQPKQPLNAILSKNSFKQVDSLPTTFSKQPSTKKLVKPQFSASMKELPSFKRDVRKDYMGLLSPEDPHTKSTKYLPTANKMTPFSSPMLPGYNQAAGKSSLYKVTRTEHK